MASSKGGLEEPPGGGREKHRLESLIKPWEPGS